MVGVAVNVTEVPEQIVEPALLTIETEGTTTGFTVNVKLLLVTEVTVAHGALLVSSQVTTSPVTSVELLYVDEFVPTFDPFSIHW